MQNTVQQNTRRLKHKIKKTLTPQERPLLSCRTEPGFLVQGLWPGTWGRRATHSNLALAAPPPLSWHRGMASPNLNSIVTPCAGSQSREQGTGQELLTWGKWRGGSLSLQLHPPIRGGNQPRGRKCIKTKQEIPEKRNKVINRNFAGLYELA